MFYAAELWRTTPGLMATARGIPGKAATAQSAVGGSGNSYSRPAPLSAVARGSGVAAAVSRGGGGSLVAR